MKKSYENTQEFLDAVHEEISIKDTIIDMGILEQKDFKGQFACCLLS